MHPCQMRACVISLILKLALSIGVAMPRVVTCPRCAAPSTSSSMKLSYHHSSAFGYNHQGTRLSLRTCKVAPQRLDVPFGLASIYRANSVRICDSTRVNPVIFLRSTPRHGSYDRVVSMLRVLNDAMCLGTCEHDSRSLHAHNFGKRSFTLS